MSQDVVAGGEEGVDDLGVPLLAGAGLEDFIDLFDGHALAVGAVAGHRVEGVGHGDDAGDERDLVAGELERIAAAVPLFVVMQHGGQHVGELLDVGENAVAQLGVLLDVLELGVGQLARLAEHGVVDADLADVVQQAGHVERVQHFRLAAQLLGEADGDAGDAIAVTAGVRVFGVDGASEGPHDAGEELGLLAIEVAVAGVDAEHRPDRVEQAGLDGAELAVRRRG